MWEEKADLVKNDLKYRPDESLAQYTGGIVKVCDSFFDLQLRVVLNPSKFCVGLIAYRLQAFRYHVVYSVLLARTLKNTLKIKNTIGKSRNRMNYDFFSLIDYWYVLRIGLVLLFLQTTTKLTIMTLL